MGCIVGFTFSLHPHKQNRSNLECVFHATFLKPSQVLLRCQWKKHITPNKHEHGGLIKTSKCDHGRVQQNRKAG